LQPKQQLNSETEIKYVKMDIIDIDFDFRKDSMCDDPDRDSQKLYEAHKLLWSKESRAIAKWKEYFHFLYCYSEQVG